MQRHPSGCDPQAFRGRHSLSIPRKNARSRTPYDPVLETLPGMQTALGELERSGPSLYRGTIERSNLNRLANDLAEILVRHVNRIRFQAKIAAQSSPNHGTVTQPEPMMPRKRVRPLRYIEESERPDGGFYSTPPRPYRAHVTHESRGLSNTSSYPQDPYRTRPQRRRRLIRQLPSEESDEDDVHSVYRMERPRRSKEIRGNLNDDMAYEYMERVAREKEDERRRQREYEETEKQNAMLIDDSSEDDYDEEFVPKIVCPKPYVRERALESDFASLTPIITDPDDDTDTEHHRKWNARRTRKTVHDGNKAVHPIHPVVQKQFLIFPLGRKARLVRDVVVNTYLMKALAKTGKHHENYKRFLQPLPNIPAECLQPGGRHWEDFQITEGFRKAASESLFHEKVAEQHHTSVTPNGTVNYPENAAIRNNVDVQQKEYVHRPTEINEMARGSGNISAMKEASNPVKAYSVDPQVSPLQFLARERAGRDNMLTRKLNGLNQAQHDVYPLVNQGGQRWISTQASDARAGKAVAVGPLGEKVPPEAPIRPMPMPTMRQDVGRRVNHIDQEHLSSINQNTDGRRPQAFSNPNAPYAMRSNDYQQNLRMPYNHQMVLSSNQGGSSQMHAHYRQPMYHIGQDQTHLRSISAGHQMSTSAQVPQDQRHSLQTGSQRQPTREEIQAYQVMVQRSLASPQTNAQLLQIQAIQEWQRQVRMQSLQQQRMLQRQFQQQQQLLMQRAAQNMTPQAQHISQAGQRIVDQQLTSQFENQTSAVREGSQAGQRIVNQQLTRQFGNQTSAVREGSQAGQGILNQQLTRQFGNQTSAVREGSQAGQRIVNQQLTRQFGNQTSAVRGVQPRPMRESAKSVYIESNTRSGIEGDGPNTSRPLHSPQADMNERRPTVLRGTEAGSFGVQDRRIAQPSTLSIAGSKSHSLNGHRLSQTSNALILPDSDADFDTTIRDHKSDWQDNAKKQRSEAPRNMRVTTNEVSATVASPDIASEVHLVKTQPPALPTSSVRGVPGWQWERLDCLITQTNSQNQRQYEEEYRAQYELQFRKVMEEIRKKSEGTGAEYE